MGKRFELTVRGSVVLEVNDIWPDGDAPESPTAEDVRRLISDEGGFSSVLIDWSLEDNFNFDVFEIKPRKEA